MRKKSHISIARGIIKSLEDDYRINHKFTFYIGSIWPDCTPSFLTRRHCIDGTFDIFTKNMYKFLLKNKNKEKLGIMSTMRMGILTHYLADYFTFPHNTHYEGGFTQHCVYEEELKKKMYKFIDGLKKSKVRAEVCILHDIDDIRTYVKEKHEQYMHILGNVDSDCSFSFYICASVVKSLLDMSNYRPVVA